MDLVEEAVGGAGQNVGAHRATLRVYVVGASSVSGATSA